MNRVLVAVFAAASLFFSAFGAQAVTLTFDGLPENDEILAPYSEKGFELTCAAGCNDTWGAFFSHRSGSRYSQDQSGTSSSISTGYVGMTTQLQAVGGGTFDLNSIDFADFNLFAYAQELTMTWTLPGGGTGLKTFTVNELNGAGETYILNLLGVTSVSWQVREWLQWDNVVLNQPSTVPIPAALPLFLTAVAALGIAGSRQRKRAASA